MSADSSALGRQWSLLRLLSSRRYGVTVKQAADELGVDDKTVRRYLDCFKSMGFPLKIEEKEYGRKVYRIQPTSVPALGFNYDEAIALYLGRQFLEPLAGTTFFEAANQAFKKIREMLGEDALDYLQKMAANIHSPMFGASDYQKKADIIDALSIGIEDTRQTMLVYHSLSATEPVEYDIDPYGFVYYKNSLYLIAFAPDCKEMRHFKVDRMHEIEVSKSQFQKPKDFNLAEYMENSFGVFSAKGEWTVRVRFLPPVVRFVEESRWHGSQRIERQPDGSLLAEFRLSALEEIRSWLLGFGANAVVLDPQELRDSIRAEASSLLALYAQSATDGRNRPSANRSKSVRRLG